MNDLDDEGALARRLDAITHAPSSSVPAHANCAQELSVRSEDVRGPAALDIVEEWGHGSFPASDPPANW